MSLPFSLPFQVKGALISLTPQLICRCLLTTDRTNRGMTNSYIKQQKDIIFFIHLHKTQQHRGCVFEPFLPFIFHTLGQEKVNATNRQMRYLKKLKKAVSQPYAATLKAPCALALKSIHYEFPTSLRIPLCGPPTLGEKSIIDPGSFWASHGPEATRRHREEHFRS